MEFSKKVLEKIYPILIKYDISVVEQESYSLKLQSNYLLIVIVHNQFESSYTLWLGKNDKKLDMIEIDNDILINFFHSKLKLSQVPEDVFISNLMLFFKNEAKQLLSGDMFLIDKIEKFDLARSRKYTQDLIANQNLAAINKAWEDKDYREFVRRMNLIDKSKLPLSYELKYKIANQKL